MILGTRPELIIYDDIVETKSMENPNERDFQIHLLARAILFRRGTYGGEGFIGSHYVYSSLCHGFQIRQASWSTDNTEENTFNFFSRLWEAKPAVIFSRLSPKDFRQVIQDLAGMLIHVSMLTPAEQNLLIERLIKYGNDVKINSAPLHQL